MGARGLRTVTMRGEGGRVICERCEIAAGPVSRARGLLGRSGLEAGAGLLLKPTFSIHTLFMRFPIDVVFLDRDQTVVDVVRELRPWRAATRFRARSVLELSAGEADRIGLRVGERLQPEEAAA
ncbi:MAG: uncharacterized protein QOG06_505 [Gaiellaceae bacterium]|jgi:uncharacterized membrane protein (UPF0127 family)|nr:uncharacterized protein [Gaiellaceae bacterium]